MSQFTGNTDAGPPRAGLSPAVAAGLAVLCVAQFVVVLDVTIVATALPAIGADLGFARSQLSWVITAYTIVLAGLLILGGRAADLAGPRLTFRAGLILFSVASLACALAWNPPVLIVTRMAQGAGAALLSPAALAAVNELIRDPAARRRALGWWTAAAAGGGASGWVLGGLITEVAGWRWVFAVNAPVGLIALLLSLAALRPLADRRTRQPQRSLDLVGAVSVTAGMGLAVLGLSRLAEDPWRWDGWIAAAMSAMAVAVFVRHESGVAHPLVPGGLVRRRGVIGGNLTAAALTASTTPAMLTAILYVQDTLHLSPARGSLLFPAFNLAVIGGSLLAPAAISRFGPRAMLAGGFACVIVGIVLLTTLPGGGLPVILLLASFAVVGTGLGSASVASTTAGMAEATGAERGVAAGLLNSTAQLGSALGLAVTSPLIASAAPMTGYRLGFGAAAVVAATGALGALAVLPAHRRSAVRRPPQATSLERDGRRVAPRA